jgi:hypothetical protein
VADGSLQSTGAPLGEDVPSNPTLGFSDFGTPQDVRQWNPATHKFDLGVPPLHSMLRQQAFWDRWTTDERNRFNCYATCGRAQPPPSAVALNQPTVQQAQIIEFRTYLAASDTVDCNQSYIQQNVQFCETINILAAGRAAVILA